MNLHSLKYKAKRRTQHSRQNKRHQRSRCKREKERPISDWTSAAHYPISRQRSKESIYKRSFYGKKLQRQQDNERSHHDNHRRAAVYGLIAEMIIHSRGNRTIIAQPNRQCQSQDENPSEIPLPYCTSRPIDTENGRILTGEKPERRSRQEQYEEEHSHTTESS